MLWTLSRNKYICNEWTLKIPILSMINGWTVHMLISVLIFLHTYTYAWYWHTFRQTEKSNKITNLVTIKPAENPNTWNVHAHTDSSSSSSSASNSQWQTNPWINYISDLKNLGSKVFVFFFCSHTQSHTSTMEKITKWAWTHWRCDELRWMYVDWPAANIYIPNAVHKYK